MKNINTRAALVKDIAMFLFLLSIFALMIIMTMAPKDAQFIYFALVLACFAAALIGFLGRPQMCTILMGVVASTWVGYKLYGVYAYGTPLILTDYLLVPIPLIIAGSVQLFEYGVTKMESENVMLRQQVQELVLVDELTGLYNLRAMYRDMNVMIHFCRRNKLPISLMIVELRYEQELRGMLSARRYDMLRQRLAEIIQDTVRAEDKTYSIDEKGSFAILLTTDLPGMVPVRARILSMVGKEDAFKDVLDKDLSVALRIAGKQYTDGMDLMEFKRTVESELVYDV